MDDVLDLMLGTANEASSSTSAPQRDLSETPSCYSSYEQAVIRQLLVAASALKEY